MVRGAALIEPSEVAENPGFFSPERLERDHRSKPDDLWALGCLMYLGLTGHAPFAGTSKEEVRARLTQGPAAPLAVFDVCDDDLANIAESMIAIAMPQRVTSASKIRDQLADWLQRKKVRIGPMLDVIRQEPSVRVSLASLTEPKAPLVDRLPSTAELLSRARTNTKKSSLPPPLPAATSDARPKSLPPPLPTQVVHESRPPEAPRPKSLPPPLPVEGMVIPKAPAMPLLPIDPPVAPPTPPPPAAKPAMPAVRVVEPRLEPADLPAPPLPAFARKPAPREPAPLPPPAPLPEPAPQPVSNRPLANLFDDIEAEPAPAVDRVSAPLAPLLGAPASTSLAPTPSTQSTAQVAELAPPQKRFPVWIVVAAVAALVVGGYAVFRFTGSGPAGETSGAGAASSAVDTTTHAAATPAPSASPSASATPSVSTTPSAAPLSVPDPEQCLESLLAPGAVAEGAKPNFTFLCEASDPRKVASQIRSVVIRAARGGVTDAMREWAVMGWYEYAAFASMKGRCCPSAPKIVLPSTSGLCAPMDDALNKISDVSKPGATEAEQDAALKGYRESLLCIARGGQHGVFGPYDPPSGGQDTAFMKTFARTRK